LHAHYFKFTINANIVNIPVEATFDMSILCLITMVSIFNSWSVTALTVSWLIWSQQFNRTHFR